ncbi:MAG: hypothetical protein ACOCX5_03105 [Chloroflexota bacterium]
MSIFSDDWRACLREQYKYVIRSQDTVTESSLNDVMYSSGFTEDELKQLRIEATMRVEDNPEGFRPDMNLFSGQTVEPVGQAFKPHPAECQCPSCVNLNVVPHDSEGQPIPIDPEEAADRARFAAEQAGIKPEEDEDDEDDDDEAPQQLSMF